MLLALLALFLREQGAGNREQGLGDRDPGPVRVTVSGRLELDGVARGGTLNEASFWTPGGLAATSGADHSETFFSPFFRLRFDVDFSPRVAAVLDLGNRRIDFDSPDPRLQNERVADDRISLLFRQAYIALRAWPIEGIEWNLGFAEIRHDPSGWGQPLFLSSDAESPWGELPDSTTPPFPAFSTNTVPQTRRDELQPAGLMGSFTRDCLRASLWLLPAVIEGGQTVNDEALYGLDASMNFGKIAVGAIGALWVGGTDLLGFSAQDQEVWTVGGWVRGEFGLFDGYVESYRQFGRAGRIDTTGDGQAERLVAEGFALRAGARVRMDAASKPWLAAEFLWISGDESALDDREGRFLSYENNDATPIVEGNEFGLDIDSNYVAVRGSVGISVWRVDFRAAVSFFTLLEPMPLAPDPAFGVSGRSDRLGTEVDFGVRVPWSRAVSLDATLSALLGSEVLEEFTRLRENEAYLLTIGTRLQF